MAIPLLTVDQAKAYLSSIGIVMPDFMLEIIVEQINSINDCLDANYNPATGILIRLYLLGLFGVVNGDRYLTSRRAPNGASQSFAYRSMSEKWRSLYPQLMRLDSAGCTSEIVPESPDSKSFAYVAFDKGCRP